MNKNILVYSIIALLATTNLYAAKEMSDTVKELMNKAQKEVTVTTPKELHKLIEDDEVEFVQLDVRENDQYGHGEIWTMEKVKLTRGYVEYKVEEAIPNKKAKIIVVCCSGKRAVFAAQTMKKLGYTNVSYLKDGVGGWLESGYPLDTVFGELYLKK